jgi:hypothetical protein
MDFLAAAIFSNQFEGAIGNHLISVHISGGARSGLKNVDNKLFVVFSCDYFLGGGAIAVAIPPSNKPRASLATAAAYLTRPSVWMNVGGKPVPLIGKFSTARCVCAP